MRATRSVSIETPTHGRVLVEEATESPASGLLVAFHGYGQNADDVLGEVRQIPGVSRWRILAVQALHRFYTRDSEKVIASWMTREDREAAIRDNVEYVNRVIEQVPRAPGSSLCFLGFSQGAAMAYRAALLGRHRASGVIVVGGDIPPELKMSASREWPPVLIGAGVSDSWYTATKLDADVAFLVSQDIPHEVIRFAGGHEWTDELRRAVGDWLASEV